MRGNPHVRFLKGKAGGKGSSGTRYQLLMKLQFTACILIGDGKTVNTMVSLLTEKVDGDMTM